MISSSTDRGVAMTSSRKFMFETYFDRPHRRPVEKEPEPVEPPAPMFSEEEIEAARAQGFVEGRAEGIAEMQNGIDQRVAASLEGVIAELHKLDSAHRSAISEAQARVIELALAIVRKAAPRLAAEQAREAVEALVGDCLSTLTDEPRVVIRVGNSMLEHLREGIDDIAARSGFAGDIILLPDDDLAEPDCRIEWADGGTEQSSARVWAEIDRIVDGYLSSRGGGPTDARRDRQPEAPEHRDNSPPPEEKLNG